MSYILHILTHKYCRKTEVQDVFTANYDRSGKLRVWDTPTMNQILG